MMSVRLPSSFAVVGIAGLIALAACSKKDEAPVDSPAAATAVTEAPKALEVGDIDMGRHVGVDKKITDKTDDFAPTDTIYASIDTKNAGSGKLTARWTFQDGAIVHVDSQMVSTTGDATSEFHIVKPGGWPVGKYTIHVLLNDAEVKTKEITVKK